MADVKEIDKKTYVWSHVGVILFHSIIATILILSRYYEKLFNTNSRDVVLVIGFLLLIISLLSLWPVLKDYDRIEIE